MKTPPQKKAKAGDVVRIPLPKGAYGFAKVLYTSQRYRDVMLLGVARGTHLSSSIPTGLDFTAGLFYTSVACPVYNSWDIVARVTPSDSEAACSLRIVAGDVWIGDTHLRPASNADRTRLPQMSVLGCGILQSKICEFFTHDT